MLQFVFCLFLFCAVLLWALLWALPAFSFGLLKFGSVDHGMALNFLLTTTWSQIYSLPSLSPFLSQLLHSLSNHSILVFLLAVRLFGLVGCFDILPAFATWAVVSWFVWS